MALYLYDDVTARDFAPFILTRPVGELRAGAVLLRHRWESATGIRAAGFLSAAHLARFEELDAPPAVASEELPAGSIVANTRCAVALGAIPSDAEIYTCEGEIAAVRLARAIPVTTLAEGGLALDALAGAGGETEEIGGRWIREVWDLIALLSSFLTDDIAAIGPHLDTIRPDGITATGDHPLYIEEGASVESQVHFDLSAGPVLVVRGATILAFTRVAGPCVVGDGSIVSGGRVSGCAIGDHCKVSGEISASVMLGHANKGHEGFVGHSYLGRWVNLGAGTTTSNLKNTYGKVALWTPRGVRPTGLQFLGTLFGDHAKTGIGLRLTTGTVLGAGANVFDQMPPRYVPPFAWGGAPPYGRWDMERFLVAAERMMARRQIALGRGAADQLRAAFAVETAG